MTSLSSRPLRAVIIAGVAASAIGGTTMAVAASGDGTRARITVCADAKSKELRLVPNRTTSCGKGEKLLTWTAKGKPGRTGATGNSAYDIAASYGFEGSEAEWLDSLQGRDGTDGVDGDPGVDGQDGASAYDIAVGNGFTGTEPEWLASLEGERGPVGPRGSQGIQGDQGATGTFDANSVYIGDGFVEFPNGGEARASCNSGDVPLSGAWDIDNSGPLITGAPIRSYPSGHEWIFEFAAGSEVKGPIQVVCLDVTP